MFDATSSRAPSFENDSGTACRISSSDRRSGGLRSDAGELGNDLGAVGLERLLLAVCHEIDVELVDADILELFQLRLDLGRIADDTEAIADLVCHELAVGRSHARVVVVVVEL